jgi:hypothetical protein
MLPVVVLIHLMNNLKNQLKNQLNLFYPRFLKGGTGSFILAI